MSAEQAMRERMAKLRAAKAGGAAPPPSIPSALGGRPPTVPPPMPTSIARTSATTGTTSIPNPPPIPGTGYRPPTIPPPLPTQVKTNSSVTSTGSVPVVPRRSAASTSEPTLLPSNPLTSQVDRAQSTPSAPPPPPPLPPAPRPVSIPPPPAPPAQLASNGNHSTNGSGDVSGEDAKARAMRLLAMRRAARTEATPAPTAPAQPSVVPSQENGANVVPKAESEPAPQSSGSGIVEDPARKRYREQGALPDRPHEGDDGYKRVRGPDGWNRAESGEGGGDYHRGGFRGGGRGGYRGRGGRGGYTGENDRGTGGFGFQSAGAMSRGHRARPGCTVRVEGFPFDATPDQVERLMRLHGDVVVFTMTSGASSCSCEYADPASARRAVERLSGTTPFGFGTRPLQASIYAERALRNQETFYADLDGGVALTKDKAQLTRAVHQAIRAQGLHLGLESTSQVGGSPPVITPMAFVQDTSDQSAAEDKSADFVTEPSKGSESSATSATSAATSAEIAAAAEAQALELLEANEGRTAKNRVGLGASLGPESAVAVPTPAAPVVATPPTVVQPEFSWAAIAASVTPDQPETVCVARHYTLPLGALFLPRTMIQYADIFK